VTNRPYSRQRADTDVNQSIISERRNAIIMYKHVLRARTDAVRCSPSRRSHSFLSWHSFEHSINSSIVGKYFNWLVCRVTLKYLLKRGSDCNDESRVYDMFGIYTKLIKKTYHFINVVNGVSHSHKTANIFFSFDSVA